MVKIIKDGIYRGMKHIELITSMYVVLSSGLESNVQLGCHNYLDTGVDVVCRYTQVESIA